MTGAQRHPTGTDSAIRTRRITLLTSVFPSPWLPTKGAFNFELARAVARQHSIRVINPVSWTDEWSFRGTVSRELRRTRSEVREGVIVHYPRYYYPPKICRPQYDHFLRWSMPRQLQRQLCDFRPEAMVGYWTHPDGTVAVQWARAMRAAAWVMVGGSDVLLLAEEPRRARKIRETLEAADGILVLSNALRLKLLNWGLPPDRVHLFRRGIDRLQFSPGDRHEARRKLGLASSCPVLVWIGRMVPVKGLDILLSAAERLVDRGMEFELNLVGDGPLRKALEHDVATRGLARNVRFAGIVSHGQLADWYRAADWSVLSSLSEGIPNVLLESHACGTPFVSTDVGGVSEIVQRGIDRMAVGGDAESLAEELAVAISQSPLSFAGRVELAATVPSLEEAAELWLQRIVP